MPCDPSIIKQKMCYDFVLSGNETIGFPFPCFSFLFFFFMESSINLHLALPVIKGDRQSHMSSCGCVCFFSILFLWKASVCTRSIVILGKICSEIIKTMSVI